MSDTPPPDADAASAPLRGRRWKVGTVIAIAGLVGFVVLGAVILVGLLRDAHSVDLFPWMFASLAVGVLGMVLAGAPSHSQIARAEAQETDAEPPR